MPTHRKPNVAKANVPGGNTRQVLAMLGAYESRNITYVEPDGSWPIVWKKARGMHVWDIEGRKYLDLTAAFGVAATGHANPRVVQAGQRQMSILLHAMGDVHPHALKAQLARELSRITFERWTKHNTGNEHRIPERNSPGLTGKTIFCNSGFEAVEAALKTAKLATGRSGIIAFENAYHGLGYGALNATHRRLFRSPFAGQLGQFGHFVSYPATDHQIEKVESAIRTRCKKSGVGAVLVEPIQGRGGIHVPPLAFLPVLRKICDDYGMLLIADEIYTGFGRTGRWFACEHSQVIPDIICLGKALTGGFPLSACVGSAAMMDQAWPVSQGEAIHTSTFLGHPVGCAMALAQIREIEAHHLVDHSARLGSALIETLSVLEPPPRVQASARGLGLMAGLELRTANGRPNPHLALLVIKEMLRHGFILLPEGAHSNVISLTPPLILTKAQSNRAVQALQAALAKCGSRSKETL